MKPFTFKPAYSILVKFARDHHIPAAQLDFVIKGSTKGWHRTWRFRATYARTLGRDIEDTDFDNYVNICINGSHEIYASGGHLWCSIPATQSYGLKVV